MGETSRVERTLRRDRLRSRIGPRRHERRPVGPGAAAPGTQPASPTGCRQERSGESNRASGSRRLEHPGAKLVLGHLDDPEAFRSGGLAPDQENPLPRDSERLRNEPQQPRIRPATFRGRDHVDPSTPSRKPPIRSRDDRGCTRTATSLPSTSMSREPESRTIGSVFQQDLVAGLLDVNITGQRCPHAVQLYHHEAEAVGDGRTPRLVLSNRTDVAPTPHR